jgi:hypothetical protein
MRVGAFLPTYSRVKGMWHTAPGKGNGGVCGSVVAVPALLARLMVRGPLWYSSMSGSVELQPQPMRERASHSSHG